MNNQTSDFTGSDSRDSWIDNMPSDQEPQEPGQFDCHSKWREYFLSISKKQFARGFEYLGFRFECEYIYSSPKEMYDGMIVIDDEGGATIVYNRTREQILDFIELLNEEL
jgi:hypothetical protein